MQEEIQGKSTALPTGGIFGLQASAPNLLRWLGPTWAVVCGLIASGGFDGQADSWLRLALLILLVDGGWGSLWTALGATDWATPLSRWRAWRKSTPTAQLPYTQPEAPGGKLSHIGGGLRSWWTEVLWPTCGPALLTLLIALPTAALIAILLGEELILLSVAAVATMQLATIWTRGGKDVPPGWDALITVTLPWLAGHVAFGLPSLRSVALAGLFAVPWGGAWSVRSGWGRLLTVGGQLVAAVTLLILRSPLAAGAAFLFLVPQVYLLSWIRGDDQRDWYVRHTRPWLMAAMLVVALSI